MEHNDEVDWKPCRDSVDLEPYPDHDLNVDDDQYRAKHPGYRSKFPEFQASACVFNPERKLLVLQRAGWKPEFPLKYTLPGGHYEKGENIPHTAIRELLEETKLNGKIGKFVGSLFYKSSEGSSQEFYFIVTTERYDVTINKESVGYLWVTLDEVKELDLALPSQMWRIITKAFWMMGYA